MLFKKKILGIVPVRSGSKRLRMKNFRIYKGKPLYLNTINLARKCRYIDRIIVTTDSNNIISKIKNMSNVTLRLREKKLAEDKSSAYEVILDVLENIDNKYDYFIYLQPTSPLRNRYDLESSLKKIIYKNKSSLVSSKNYSKFPNGAIYISEINTFKKKKFFDYDIFLNYQMPKIRSIDIDYLKDFELAKKF